MWTREKDILWALKETGGSHRHICRISWVCEEKLTLALKPLGLCSLEKYMVHSESARVLTSRQWLNIAEKIADALQFLHGRKLCHNDVQPSNIVLGEDLTDDVFLVDFGQACRLSPSGQALATSFNNVDPPLRYAPPEVLGEAPVTRGSEVRYASTIMPGMFAVVATLLSHSLQTFGGTDVDAWCLETTFDTMSALLIQRGLYSVSDVYAVIPPGRFRCCFFSAMFSRLA